MNQKKINLGLLIYITIIYIINNAIFFKFLSLKNSSHVKFVFGLSNRNKQIIIL